MLAHKAFIKRTKRGNIIKVIREHYLRDDIYCGSPSCQDCELPEEANSLCKTPTSLCSLVNFPHYLVIDTNIALEQMDLLESDGIQNVIILQTVLEEVRHRSSAVYKRLKEVISTPSKGYFVFINEHRKETYVERLPGETANDRNDRAIRQACIWLKEHWRKEGKDGMGTVVLLSDDRANREKALESDLQAFSSMDYASNMPNFPNLMDKLKSKDSEESKDRKLLYREHLSPLQIRAGVKNGKLMQGVFYLSRTNFMEGTVSVEGQDPILIQGLESMNRAVDGDTVVIRLLEKQNWSAPLEAVVEDDNVDQGDTLEVSVDLVGKDSKSSSQVQPTGMVVGIVRRKWRQYCGILLPNPVKGSNRHLFAAFERKIPRVRIETRQGDTLQGQRIIVAIDSWPRHSRYPLGHFVRAIGKIGDKAAENEVLLLEHDIPHSNFSEAVLQCLPKMPWVVTDKDLSERVDCRHLDICSVDPPGCTDIDDALHAKKLDNGNFEVGVHIADVGHFVRPGTAMDKEAAKRSTTVYLTDRRIDMLPELLSSNLCSLRGGVERFAFSCIWEMDSEANILSTRFHKSLIKSRQAMTYGEAQLKIDDKNDKDVLAEGLRILLRLSKILKQRRMENGALLLASSEVRFSVDSETADPIDVQEKKVYETNSMVEEFMLAANISAAQRIFKEFPECSMLRRHPSPPHSNFQPLIQAAKQQGFTIEVDTGKLLANTLDAAKDPQRPYVNLMLRMIATRCMLQAVYFASGTIEEAEFRHFGLACPIYTHFTSPIRRYADVIVHRLLAVSVNCDSTYPELLDKKFTQKVAENINYRHRMAQYASRASVALFTRLYFKNAVRDETGYVLSIKRNAIQVLIPKYGLEGTLFVSEKPMSGGNSLAWNYDEEEPSLACSGVKVSLFQKVTVQISLDTNLIQHDKLRLQLVNPEIPGYSVPPVLEKTELKRKSDKEDDSPIKKTKL